MRHVIVTVTRSGDGFINTVINRASGKPSNLKELMAWKQKC